MKRPIKERFLEKVVKQDSGCHEWAGSLAKNGYGNFHKDGKTHYSHRIAWEIEHGEEPSDYVLHKCDNRKCVNPSHLFLGTAKENTQDMIRNNRMSRRDGEYNNQNVVSSKQVEQIKHLLQENSETISSIAQRFGVKYDVVWHIATNRTWKSVVI